MYADIYCVIYLEYKYFSKKFQRDDAYWKFLLDGTDGLTDLHLKKKRI